MNHKDMALVAGEDSESDEEINTDQLHSLVLTPDGSLTGYRGIIKGLSSQPITAGIVMGEESETDEEDDAEKDSVDQPDGTGQEQGSAPLESSQSSSEGPPHAPPREEQAEFILPPPRSLLHKKLRERNLSLRRNIMERIIKLYRITCRNLTLVNSNLSKAQGTIETINSNLKRSEHELSELNSIISDINTEGRSLAPNLNIQLTSGPKKSPSLMKQRLIKGFPPQVYSLWPSTARTMTPDGEAVPRLDAGPKGQSSATRSPEGHSVDRKLKIPEAQPAAPISGEP